MATLYGSSAPTAYNWKSDPSTPLLDYILKLQSTPAPTSQPSKAYGYSNPYGLSPYTNKTLAKQYQSQSYLLQIQGYQLASDSEVNVAKSNVLKQQKELDITLEDAAKQFSQVTSAQRAQAGSSGLSVNSGSFLDVFADQASQFTTQVQRAKTVTRLDQEALMREALYKAEEYKYDIQGVQTQSSLNSLLING